MYVPEAFREDRVDVLHRMMKRIGAATLVGSGVDGLVATHVPVEVCDQPAPWGRVRCHLARANPHLGVVAEGGELLLIFQGAEGYISPSWYATKQETAKVVPTWDYVAVHAYGTPTLFEGPERLRPHLAALTDGFEKEFEESWKIDDAPSEFVDAMCKGIVGVEIRFTRIEGKWKLSQNRKERDRAGVARGLRATDAEANRVLADLVETAR